MKTFAKRLVLSCAFIGAALFTASDAEAASIPEVKIQVNDELIAFPDAQPFIDGNETLQVPLRFLSEKLGYKVDWKMVDGQVQVQLMNKLHTIDLKTGEDFALINGTPVSLKGHAVFTQERTFVPLRFISETFGSSIAWDPNNWVAIVEADGKPHASAWKAPSKRDRIIQAAQDYIGVPYVWGGSTPEGFDCSGFVKYVFETSGIELPRTSMQMHDQVGTAVTDLQVGDLVFFAQAQINHVGIYLGNDQFISATSSKGVTIATLSSKYWGARYVGAKRVL
jgi:peptidoglycan DL-endopeptidase LytE